MSRLKAIAMVAALALAGTALWPHDGHGQRAGTACTKLAGKSCQRSVCPADPEAVSRPLASVFRAWDMLDYDLYMAQWSRDMTYLNRGQELDREAFAAKRRGDFDRFDNVEVPRFDVGDIQIEGRRAMVFVTYTMTYWRDGAMVFAERDVDERYELGCDSEARRWLILRNLDHLD